MNKPKLIYQTSSPLLESMNFSDQSVVIIAGPCAIESEEQLLDLAVFLKQEGVEYLRAGAFKPRTSPYDFQGLGMEGLEILKRVKEQTKMKVVSEITSLEYLDFYLENIDIIQIGARNMQNFPLLEALGKTKKPLLLKRGFGNTLEEWLNAAEYILKAGNPNIILCERGIRTFEPALRGTLDLGGALMVKKLVQLPVITDPSHASGISNIVPDLAIASIAAGLNGVMVEIHDSPLASLSDGMQALTKNEFHLLNTRINQLKPYLNK